MRGGPPGDNRTSLNVRTVLEYPPALATAWNVPDLLDDGDPAQDGGDAFRFHDRVTSCGTPCVKLTFRGLRLVLHPAESHTT